MHKILTHTLIAAGLVSLAVFWRFLNAEHLHLYNLELITSVSLVAAVYLRRPFALLAPLLAVFLSDVVLGNS